ncbi:hypothetical protein Scep_015901 [Stephania cephalantha]|uniref:Uncharacterized protein n=1 Tax=Stephania cephalantha TaxID=152367 RepID=A0AAP0ILL6_9MAGN
MGLWIVPVANQDKILIQKSETTATTPTASEEECVKKKEIFVIKQSRKSHERPRPAAESQRLSNVKTDDYVGDVDEPTLSDPCVVATNFPAVNAAATTAVNVVRTSSCTKEEVDAILIQCGRLSRSSSANKVGGSGPRKYSGSKRSFDFDHDNNNNNNNLSAENKKGGEDDNHYSRPSHRRTPSREKDGGEHKRSSSRDRSSSSSKDQQDERSRSRGSGSRRASRSPSRRSETPSSAAATSDKSKPGKMVSVPASNGGNAAVPISNSATTVVKRVSVKRSGEAGSFRGTASPRSQSPACARPNNNNVVNNENAQQHQPSLSRNSSRKAEQSPYRRNPMSEIDENCPRREQQQQQQPTLKSQDQVKTHRRKESSDEIKAFPSQSQLTNETSAAPQGITRSRSSRRSRDLDFITNIGLNPDALLNPTSYASMLLEDIQNFHQQNNGATTNTTTTPVFTLPACVTKACSILEAVADLNSCNSEDRSSELIADWSNNKGSKNVSSNSSTLPHLGKMRLVDVKEPIAESEVVLKNGLNEPSLHKYVTVRRGVVEGEIEVEQQQQQQESSGSNSFVGGQYWATSSPCSWEPNSADSAATSRPNSNTYGETLVVVDKESSHAVSEVVGHDQNEVVVVEARRMRSSGSNRSGTPSQSGSGKKRELQHQYHQNGRTRQGRAGAVSQAAIPVAATISS